MSQPLKQKAKLSSSEKRILTRLQKDIPFSENPWKDISEELHMTEDSFLKEVRSLKKKNIIRRISATFDPRKLGFVSTLVAAKIADKNADTAAHKLNAYSEVTHNYKRDDEYNVWFTLVAENRDRITQILEEVREYEEIEELMELPAKRLFKIGVNFKI